MSHVANIHNKYMKSQLLVSLNISALHKRMSATYFPSGKRKKNHTKTTEMYSKSSGSKMSINTED